MPPISPADWEVGSVRKAKGGKIDELKTELVRAKEKAAEWQARVRDIERQITEQENLEIIRTVRGVAAAPEDLRELLDMIRAVKEPSGTNESKEDN